MFKEIILIRHGETDWNSLGKYCSFTDIPLNEKGKFQATRLSGKLCGRGIRRVYSSDMKRTRESAKLALKDPVIEELPALREMNFGIFEGLRYEEIMDRYPAVYKRWIADPFGNIIPCGEDLQGLTKRVRKALGQILSLGKEKTIAVFTHAGPIKAIVQNILDSEDIWSLRPEPASITIIDFEKGNFKIRVFNDTDHLNG